MKTAFVLVTFMSTVAFAQPSKPGTIVGTVVDQHDKPIKGESCFVDGPSLPHPLSTSSDAVGTCTFSVPAGTYTFSISRFGSRSEMREVSVTAGAIVKTRVSKHIDPDGAIYGGLMPPAVPITIRGPWITVVRKEHGEAIVTETGKQQITVAFAHTDVRIVNGRVLAVRKWNTGSKDVDIVVAGKVVGTITETGQARLPGRTDLVYFDRKGKLVNSKLALSITPAPAKLEDDLPQVMGLVVALLHAKL